MAGCSVASARRPACSGKWRLAAAKAVYCFGAAAALAAVARHRNRYALRGVLHTGVVVGLLGIREIRLYGDGQPLGRHSNAA